MTSPVLIASQISKSYLFPEPVHLFSNIDLILHTGESIAISGRSGEGKTTLLHILGTLEKADRGTLNIEGILCTSANASLIRQRSIGFIFQAFHLMEDFTALDNVLMPAWIHRTSPSKQKGIDLLAEVGLAHRASFPVKLLSGGERQRVAIARALCNDPAILLADEPSGNLDAATAENIGALLLSLVKEKKKSLILVTHEERLATLCDRRLLLSAGTIQNR